MLLALIALTVSPVLFVLARAFRGKLRRESRIVKKLESESLSIVQEVLGALRVVKAFGQEDRESQRFEQSSAQSMKARLHVVWMESRLGLLLGLTMALGTVAVLVVGARNVQAGTLTTGMTVADPRRLSGRVPNVDVVTDADIPAFFERLIERIGGLAADRVGVAR